MYVLFRLLPKYQSRQAYFRSFGLNISKLVTENFNNAFLPKRFMVDGFDWDSVKYLQLQPEQPKVVADPPLKDQRSPVQVATRITSMQPNNKIPIQQSPSIRKSISKSPLKNTITVETVSIDRPKKKKVVKAIEDQDLDELFNDGNEFIESKSNDPKSPTNADTLLFQSQLDQIFDGYSTEKKKKMLEDGYLDFDNIVGHYVDDHATQRRKSLDAFMELLCNTSKLDLQCAEFTKKESKATRANSLVANNNDSKPTPSDLDSIINILESTQAYDNQSAVFTKKPAALPPNYLVSAVGESQMSGKGASIFKSGRSFSQKFRTSSKKEKRQSLPAEDIDKIFDLVAKVRSYDDQSAVFTRKSSKLDSISETDTFTASPGYEEFPRIDEGEALQVLESTVARSNTIVEKLRNLKKKLVSEPQKEVYETDLKIKKLEYQALPLNTKSQQIVPLQNLPPIQNNVRTISQTNDIDSIKTASIASSSPILAKRISLIFGLDAPVRTVETTIDDRQVTAVYQSDSESDSDLDMCSRVDWV